VVKFHERNQDEDTQEDNHLHPEEGEETIDSSFSKKST